VVTGGAGFVGSSLALALRETATRLELLPEQRLAGVGPEGLSEEFPLAGARTLYGASKLASELLVAEFAEAPAWTSS
jgi:CDP-paratose 2-epimerase